MRLESSTDPINFKTYPAPKSFPFGCEVEGPDQIPVLKGISLAEIPKALCAFDGVRTDIPYDDVGIHFYRDDSKFSKVLRQPEFFVQKFSKYGAVLTPDVTLGTEMARCQRANNTFASRAAGAVWESRGLKVIPSLRWVSAEDLELVATGVCRNGVIAVSSNGMFRDYNLRREFDFGLNYLLERLTPAAIIFHGKITEKQKHRIEQNAQLAHFLTKMGQRRFDEKSSRLPDEGSLFSA